MKVRWTVAALTAATLLGLTSCQGEPIGPPPTPTPDPTTTAPSPTPSGTPTPSFDPDEQSAITEAEAAYRAWVEVLERMYKSPRGYSLESARKEIYKAGGDPVARRSLSEFDNFKRGGLIQTGSVEIVDVEPSGVELVVPQGSYQEVRLDVCTDNSRVAVLFEETRKPAGSPPKQTRFVSRIKAWFYEKSWHIVEDAVEDVSQKC